MSFSAGTDKEDRIKSCFVLEGGAMRGMFTCGVLDLLFEEGIRVDGIAGISAGAAFGCNYKSHQPGRALRYNLRYWRDRRYCSMSSLITTGDLYNAEFCYRRIPEELDPFDRETFKEDPTEFYCGATDINSGECVYHKCTDGGEEDLMWMRASASMPLVSKTVNIGDLELLDGGIADPVPYGFMKKSGFQKMILILTRPAGYRKREIPHIAVDLLFKKHPYLAEAVNARAGHYNRQMEEIDMMEKTGEAVVIRPDTDLPAGKTPGNPEKLEISYAMGRKKAELFAERIKSFLCEPLRVECSGKVSVGKVLEYASQKQ